MRIGLLASILLIGCPKPVDVSAVEPVPAPAEPARGQLPTDVGLAARPEAIPTPAVEFTVPRAADFRSELRPAEGAASGVPLYHARTTEFPLVELRILFKGGAYLDPKGHLGLATSTGALMRSGGTASKTPEQLDEAFDFLAAEASVAVGTDTTTARLNCLVENLDPCLDLFVEMLRSPRFDAGRRKVLMDGRLEDMRQRNDDARDIVEREWDALMFGRGHSLGAVATKADLDAVDAADLKALHAQIFHPGNMIVQASGDITRDDLAARLEARFAGWKVGAKPADPPAPGDPPAAGVYHVQKAIPQGKVRFGMRGVTRDDEDALALRVMNDILGGGGFTARITKRVRSDEGLAYSARSAFFSEVWFPGEFRAWTESKNETVALATRIMLDEVERIRTEPVSDAELNTTKTSLIETFPRTFESKAAMLALFADDELTGRDPEYWAIWREKVAAVTAADVQRVAQEHLDPSKMVILVVGDWDPIAKGDLGKRADMQKVRPGEVVHLPLRDPLTDKPL